MWNRRQVNYYAREFPDEKEGIITATLALGVLRLYEFERLCTITRTPYRKAVEYLHAHPTEFCLSMSKGVGEELDAKAIARFIIANGNEYLDIVNASLNECLLALSPDQNHRPTLPPGGDFS